MFYQVQVGNSCGRSGILVHSGCQSIMDVLRDKELERSVASVAVGPISSKTFGLRSQVYIVKEKSMFKNTKQLPAVEWDAI